MDALAGVASGDVRFRPSIGPTVTLTSVTEFDAPHVEPCLEKAFAAVVIQRALLDLQQLVLYEDELNN